VPQNTVDALVELGVEGIVVVLDGDSEGVKGVNRTIEKVLPNSKMKCAMKRLPDGVDPDEYINKYGVKGFNNLKMMPFSEFWMRENKDIEPKQRFKKILEIMSDSELGNQDTHFEALENVCNELGINVSIDEIKERYKATATLKYIPRVANSISNVREELKFIEESMNELVKRLD
jgi:DNA primase